MKKEACCHFLVLGSVAYAASQRVHRQLTNAQEKLERAQRHAEEKRHASQQTIERLQREYEQMDIERCDNDKLVEELRKEADDTEAKVTFPSPCLAHGIHLTPPRWRNTSRKAKPSSTSSLPSIGSFGMKQVGFPYQASHFR